MPNRALINHDSILQGGRYRGVSIDGKDPELVLRWYRFMLRLRMCEEAIMKEYHIADEMRCPTHFCLGQEAVPAALSTLITSEDYLFSHHRSHGYYLAKGAPLQALLAELYGRETGANGGLAGSQDISYAAGRFHSGAILAGATGIAVGAAMALQLKRDSAIAVTGFGEGAIDEGLFWEALSFASLHTLPLVFLCENNRYATYSPLRKRQPADNFSERVASFKVKTWTLFGNDVVAVHQALEEAIREALGGRGPCFVETFTYRWNGHVGPEDDDHLGYRPSEELAFWKANCPILLLEEPLLAAGWLTPAKKDAMLNEFRGELKEAFAFAKRSAFPRALPWHDLNYSLTSPVADRLLVDAESTPFNHDQVDAIPEPY